eukprot:7921254-Karenia_brevis.AAC.1
MALRMELMAMEERMLKQNRLLMEEVVGAKMEAISKEVQEHMKKVEDKADRANASASAAHEAIRAIRADMGKLELGREPNGVGANSSGRGRKSESNDRYELELIVSGFPFNTPKREIEEKL